MTAKAAGDRASEPGFAISAADVEAALGRGLMQAAGVTYQDGLGVVGSECVAADKVLLTNQSDPDRNGIWVCADVIDVPVSMTELERVDFRADPAGAQPDAMFLLTNQPEPRLNRHGPDDELCRFVRAP